ncbi:MAG: type II toxin-antitoxin system HicA family toxin [Pseudomonadota bacterium]
MNSRNLIKALRAEGWHSVGSNGSHHHFKHPDKPGRVTVIHPRKDIAVGTLRSIYKQAGWKWPPR